MNRLAMLAVSGVLLANSARCSPTDVLVTPEPPEISFEEEDRLVPGLILKLCSHEAAGDEHEPPFIDARRARLLALRVTDGQTVSPFFSAGPFRADWSGYLFSELGEVVRFSFRGRGSAQLTINSATVLEAKGRLADCAPQWVQLQSGFSHLTLRYESPLEGESHVELLWSGESFLTEPVLPTVLFHDPADELLVSGSRLRHGRELFAARGCANCHDRDLHLGQSEGMPELSIDAPDLTAAGTRLQSTWSFAWLLDPTKMRDDVWMPAVHLGGDVRQTRQTAADLALFLASQKGTSAVATGETGEVSELADAGEQLYEDRGCLGCHRLTPPGEDDEFDRVSLHFVEAKYRPGALAKFLAAPHAHYASNRMPEMQLEGNEPAELAAYIRKNVAGQCAEPAEMAHADSARGGIAYVQLGCANCHPLNEEQELSLHGPTLATARRPGPTARPPDGDVADSRDAVDVAGCLAESDEDRGTAADYAFSDGERAALGEFLDTAMPSLRRRVPVEISQRYVRSLRCGVCHKRDGEPNLLGDVWYEESSTGLPPESVPALTWVGEKLHHEWMEDQFAGRLGYRPRPWMKLRMPRYPAHAVDLAAGFVAEHAVAKAPAEQPPVDAELASVGQLLTQQAPKGFFCIQCHAVGDRPPAGAYDHRGVNFAFVRERIRRDYYVRWITNPLRLDSGSKMPTLAPDGRTTDVTSVYGGDAQKQFAALWEYLRSLKKEENDRGEKQLQDAASTPGAQTRGA